MVKTEVKKISSSKRELKVTLPKEKLDAIRDQEAQKVRQEAQIPGFRKGKAPISMIKRRFAGVIESYALEKAVEQSLFEATQQEKLDFIGTPEAKKIDFDEEGNLISTIEVETLPEIELKKYKGIKLVRDKYVVTDKLVDENIQQLLKERAEVTAVDGPVEEGHRITVDMQELDETGVPIVGRKYTDVSIKVGEGQFDKDIEMQLVGVKKGETKRVEKVYPDDFPQEDYAGKKELYDITVKEIMEEKIPELTDEFVEELGDETLKTVDDLKKRVRENLERQYENESKQRLEEDLIQTLLSENPFEIPKTLVENYLDNMVQNALQRNPQLKAEDARRAYEPNAETMVKWYYLTKRIAEVEKIEVSDEEVEKFLEEYVKDEEQRKKMMANQHQVQHMKEDMFYDKVVKFLLDNAEIEENEIVLD